MGTLSRGQHARWLRDCRPPLECCLYCYLTLAGWVSLRPKPASLALRAVCYPVLSHRRISARWQNFGAGPSSRSLSRKLLLPRRRLMTRIVQQPLPERRAGFYSFFFLSLLCLGSLGYTATPWRLDDLNFSSPPFVVFFNPASRPWGLRDWEKTHARHHVRATFGSKEPFVAQGLAESAPALKTPFCPPIPPTVGLPASRYTARCPTMATEEHIRHPRRHTR